MMTWLRSLWCRIFGHTNPRIFAADTKTGRTTYVCRDCFTAWSEYDSTGRIGGPPKGPFRAD